MSHIRNLLIVLVSFPLFALSAPSEPVMSAVKKESTPFLETL